MKASNKFESRDLGQSAFNAFHSAMGLPAQWEQSSSQVAWESVAVKAIQLCDLKDGEDAREVSAKGLADALYRQFCFTDGLADEPFRMLLPAQQLAWEAAGRHLANMIGSDGSIAMSEHEQWGEWLEKRLAGFQGVTS